MATATETHNNPAISMRTKATINEKPKFVIDVLKSICVFPAMRAAANKSPAPRIQKRTTFHDLI